MTEKYRRQPSYPEELAITIPDREETEWDRQAKEVLIPTPGYPKSLTEIEAELIAGGVSVPPGLAMCAAGERARGWHPERDD